jgi:hypothetical protein
MYRVVESLTHQTYTNVVSTQSHIHSVCVIKRFYTAKICTSYARHFPGIVRENVPITLSDPTHIGDFILM